MNTQLITLVPFIFHGQQKNPALQWDFFCPGRLKIILHPLVLHQKQV